MCGIAGIINHNNVDLNALKKSLIHRGPDDQCIYVKNKVALIHTRLSILDIDNGKQPFHYEHYSIIFNGEIYNHQELRNKLSDFKFHTNSDTETLLYLYVKFGEKMFSLFDGMFAFCIYDRKKHILILARDRAGKKPLYYSLCNDQFIFASELNSLKSITKMNINEDAIQCYLRAGFIYKSYTPYKNVHKLEASSYLIVNTESLQYDLKKYYDIYDSYTEKNQLFSYHDAVQHLEEILIKSVNDRLLSSDVEVGAFLSGGIDSNLVVAIASKIKPGLKTFTVKFDGLYDESPLAGLAAKKYQTCHTELQVSMDINKDIAHILSLYGEPFMDSSAIPSFYVSKEAKKSVKVILNGDGADELFGGYRRYVPIVNPFLNFAKKLSPLHAFLPRPTQKQNPYNYLYRLFSMAGKTGLDLYLSTTSDIYEDVLSIKLNPILHDMNQFITDTFANILLTPLSKMLYLDFNLLLFSDLLVKMDIATMANSLEGRSPFLSKYLLNFVPSLPDNYKVRGFVTKRILREIAKKYLPVELINQPKRGFEVPLKKWVNLDLKEQINDNLVAGCYSENFIERDFIKTVLCHKSKIPDEKRAKILWNLFCLEMWHKNDLRNNYLY